MNQATEFVIFVIAFGIGAFLMIVAIVMIDNIASQRPCEHTSIERNTQGQRLDFDRCATILQWTEECSQ